MAFVLERKSVDPYGWRSAFATLADAGGRLGTIWGSDLRDEGARFAVHALLILDDRLHWIDLPLDDERFPDISDLFPSAGRMQRAVHDLLGLQPYGLPVTDVRQWLSHGAWPPSTFPLRRDSLAPKSFGRDPGPYPFVPVEGEGVHEIAVGPVHAGTIEPGHFRFSVIGERVLRLEERLGYTHKGIEKRFESMSLEEGARLAGRVSGDSTVAFAWAYAMAVEGAMATLPPVRALWLRALFLERERIANHLGDLGALGNDCGLAFGLSQFSRLKEDVLRTNARLFGHRYLMDRIAPGGVACDLSKPGAAALLQEAVRLEQELLALRAIYYDHAGLQDRCINCGRLSGRLAGELGIVGLAARASGHAIDARVYPSYAPYEELRPKLSVHRNGDVASRIVVRFEEALESLALLRTIVDRMPAGEYRAALPHAPARAFGAGWVEGWRGEVLVALEAGADGRVRRCHPHDPSWHNWPAIEHAILGNIVPDFPLINKSFNLSYSGVDL